MSTETEQATQIRELIVGGDDVGPARIVVTRDGDDVVVEAHPQSDTQPSLALYLSPIDAAIHAERVSAAAREAAQADA